MPGKKPTYTGRDLHRCVRQAHDAHFNPRAPYGARRLPLDFIPAASRFQSTRPIRGATTGWCWTLCGAWKFQSTRPIRGATVLGRSLFILIPFQSTRPIRGATRFRPPHPNLVSRISIHAPHTGRDQRAKLSLNRYQKFQSTRPIRGATHRRHRPGAADAISIHAPHTGRDFWGPIIINVLIVFQSTRPIRGATIAKVTITGSTPNFNPRAPYGARRCSCFCIFFFAGISIHAPHTGRDMEYPATNYSTRHFNPRAPYGARLLAADDVSRD